MAVLDPAVRAVIEAIYGPTIRAADPTKRIIPLIGTCCIGGHFPNLPPTPKPSNAPETKLAKFQRVINRKIVYGAHGQTQVMRVWLACGHAFTRSYTSAEQLRCKFCRPARTSTERSRDRRAKVEA